MVRYSSVLPLIDYITMLAASVKAGMSTAWLPVEAEEAVWYTYCMEPSLHSPLTPEQLAAVQAGNGFARVEDPTSHRVYFLIEQLDAPAISDDYVRRKIEEAYAEGDVGPLDMQATKAAFRRRQSATLGQQ
jgi:hypothetical protein